MLSVTILLAGCAGTPERICQREGPARIGEMAYINGPVVRVESVLEDSRCPVDAQCVHAGDVRIAATVISGNSKKPVELTLGKPLHIADGSLTLLSVAPRKRSDHGITPEMYRFAFDFQGGF
ncbi:MAG TPA: hypothetical protein VF503_10465 [Sphingobium sp.]|uniref:hypothetical protein n=1 Tax=Sphingobium sp. TaxID=1912891 RepID=UPI002ED4C515